MQCRRLHSRAEGGEPRREHYAVHLAFSLINGGRAAANAGVVAAATAVFALVSYVLSFFFRLFLFLSFSVCLSVCLSLVPFLQPLFFTRFTFSFPSTLFSVPSPFCGEIVRFSGRKKNLPQSRAIQQHTMKRKR